MRNFLKCSLLCSIEEIHIWNDMSFHFFYVNCTFKINVKVIPGLEPPLNFLLPVVTLSRCFRTLLWIRCSIPQINKHFNFLCSIQNRFIQ